MEEILEELKTISQNIQEIIVVDKEAYKYFKERINEIKKEIQELDDDTPYYLQPKFNKILEKIEELKLEFKNYMEKGKIQAILQPTLEQSNKISGKEKIKQHRIELYKGIVKDLYKLKNIDFSKIKEIKERWEKERQGKYKYSKIEAEKVEEALAEMFLNYQINYLRQEGKLPEEEIGTICSIEYYEQNIKERILENILENVPEDKKRRVEELIISGTLEEIVKNKEVWEVLTGKELDKDLQKNNTENKEEQEKETENEEKEESTELVPVRPKRRSEKLVLKIEKKTIFGKTKIKTKKISVRNIENYRVSENLREYLKENINRWSLIEVEIPEGVTVIPTELFYYYPRLKKVVFPETLEFIGANAFKDCKSLEDIKFPNNLKEIGSVAFKGCYNLKNIEFPNSLKLIHSGAFYRL